MFLDGNKLQANSFSKKVFFWDTLVLIKISLKTDHEGLKAAIQPVDLHEPTSVIHCPADVPALGVE